MNYGEQQSQGWTDQGLPFNVRTQVKTRALGSVLHICKSGNRVIFDAGGGVIINKKTQRWIPIHERRGGYEIDLWIRGADGEGRSPEAEHTKPGNRFHVLRETHDEEIDMYFIRRDPGP